MTQVKVTDPRFDATIQEAFKAEQESKKAAKDNSLFEIANQYMQHTLGPSNDKHTSNALGPTPVTGGYVGTSTTVDPAYHPRGKPIGGHTQIINTSTTPVNVSGLEHQIEMLRYDILTLRADHGVLNDKINEQKQEIEVLRTLVNEALTKALTAPAPASTPERKEERSNDEVPLDSKELTAPFPFRAELIAETPKAVLIASPTDGIEDTWLPRSVLNVNKRVTDDRGRVKITINKQWIIDQKQGFFRQFARS